eukprot:10460507-Alexandrium_andersonii.AAC.1
MDRHSPTLQRSIPDLVGHGRSRPVSAAIRLDTQYTMRNRQKRVRRSELELRGPKDGFEIGPRSSRG